MILLESPKGWKDYELLDSGDFEKLERFGEYILIRPEPKALWKKSMPESEWMKLAHTKFTTVQVSERQARKIPVHGIVLKKWMTSGRLNTERDP